jgi:starch-binding outer membrane protein, SusD/RagB family
MMLLTYQITNLGLYFNYLYPRGFNYVSDSEGFPVKGCPSDSTRGKGFSYHIDGQDTLIFKYLLKSRFVARNILQGDPHSNDDAQFLLYRTGPFFLKTMEIINNMGLPFQALSYLNGQDAIGVESTRSRVWCMPFKMSATGEAPTIQVNRFILEEMALEGAYEGIRWFDLVRFAERSGYQSWLGDYVSKKYPANQREAIKSRLSNPAYWYFPYYYKNVITNTLLQQKTGY